MTIDYQQVRNAAIEAIDQLGTTVEVRSQTSGQYVPGMPPTMTEIVQTTKGVLADYTEEDRPAGLVERNARRVILSPAGITQEPKTGDDLVIDGQHFEIKLVNTVKPATVVLIYDVAVVA